MRGLFHASGDRRRLRQAVARLRRPAHIGALRQTAPLSDRWGYDRGQPIDRYYIERFLARHRGDIRGHVLEVKDSRYTDWLGRGVAHRDVLDKDATNPRATIVAERFSGGWLEKSSRAPSSISRTDSSRSWSPSAR